jgi:hypothetical protein
VSRSGIFLLVFTSAVILGFESRGLMTWGLFPRETTHMCNMQNLLSIGSQFEASHCQDSMLNSTRFIPENVVSNEAWIWRNCFLGRADSLLFSYDTDRTENDASSNSCIVSCVCFGAGSCLPSRCLAKIEGYTYRHTDRSLLSPLFRVLGIGGRIHRHSDRHTDRKAVLQASFHLSKQEK